ncbi:MAG: outer membrane lipoprotein-sorting protein [Patescibacteria group bacterium]
MKKIKAIASLLSVMFLFSATDKISAAELTAEQIMEKSWQLYRQLNTEQEFVSAIVKEEGGSSQAKAFIRWIKYDPAGEDKVVIKFTEPVLDKGLGLLTWRHVKSNDEQWLKFPSQNKVRRISLGDQGKYFAGLDFTYEDARQLIGERISQFNYRLLEIRAGDYLIEARSKPGVDSAYGKRIFWIDKKFAVNKIEYYDKNSKLIKTQENSEIKISDNGLWRPDTVVITNKLLNRTTYARFTERQIDLGLSAETFSQRFLERRE